MSYQLTSRKAQQNQNHNMNWIPVSKGNLPEFDKNVLLSVDSKTPYVTIGRLNVVKESSDGLYIEFVTINESDYTVTATYWMPLPEPATKP